MVDEAESKTGRVGVYIWLVSVVSAKVVHFWFITFPNGGAITTGKNIMCTIFFGYKNKEKKYGWDAICYLMTNGGYCMLLLSRFSLPLVLLRVA